ncbi:TIGR03435 family protein [Terriglobus roseus]|uniref:Soil-associated protein, TIGR03435 family n=1 Tax=Terriglobus roseus TaxID=392734 RepID=A0A1G7IYV5_9BACT|nr:TIGR03435 family protein [Terriglobus roseus]SDF17795.1 soil-associated protein, TIGR03435 family [Terriglobus roseus]
MRLHLSVPVRSVVLACGSLLPIMSVTLPAAAAQTAPQVKLDGTWQGAVRQPDGKDNRWVVKIEKADNGWKGTMWFIDQRSPAIPIDKVEFADGTLKLNIERAFISYEGKMSPDGDTISGTRTQGDSKVPLIFARATTETAWAIPEPPPPQPKMDPNANPSFEVATIKPQAPGDKGFAFLLNRGNFIGKGLTLEKMMTISLGLNAVQIVGLPDWATQEKYDIDAKPDTPGQPSLKQFMSEVAKLMTDRYGLKYHTEKRTMTAYSLTVAKSGIKMKPSPAGSGDIPGFGLPPGRLFINNATMQEFARFLQSDMFDHPVVDQTNLGAARYNGTLKYQMDDNQLMKMGLKAPPQSDSSDTPPPLITALSEEFGLKLDSGKIPVDVIVVDSVSKPTPN